MQDPHLVAVGSGEVYNYQYDSMGRKTSLTYHWYPIFVVYLLDEHTGFPFAAAYQFSKKNSRHFSPNWENALRSFTRHSLNPRAQSALPMTVGDPPRGNRKGSKALYC
jgi:hypothetical protein